jgi:hypothetical protein
MRTNLFRGGKDSSCGSVFERGVEPDAARPNPSIWPSQLDCYRRFRISGLETIVSNGDHVQVLEQVLAALSASRHVRPIIYTDEELKFIDEKDAPGVSAYRQQITRLLHNRAVKSLPHEQIIAKLDQVSQTFRVLIIKTNFTLPYTSVFLQLDCAYWSADAEQRLRAAMAKQHHQ